MYQFVRFLVDDETRFAALQRVFDAIKVVKNLDFANDVTADSASDHNIDQLKGMMPANVVSNFDWPSAGPVGDHRLEPTLPIAISPPGTFIGARWSFVRILELIDLGEYSLVSCQRTMLDTAELRIEAYSYPYGGLNSLIALVEGFGFKVVGVNECGRYEPLDTGDAP
jgi:hypothetical protein